MLSPSMLDEIRGVIEEADLDRKLEAAWRLCAARETIVQGGRGPEEKAALSPALRPGRPPGLLVLEPGDVPERGALTTSRGRLQLMHAVANIELAAVELALLTAGDFPWMEAEFHQDWLRVAAEEVEHFRLVRTRLRRMGTDFGAEPIHLGLFQAVLEEPTLEGRLGVVPRILEARGLDVSASLRRKLAGAGDRESVEALERIYRDEIGHVAAGTRWFRRVCADSRVDPEVSFLALWERHRGIRRGRPGPIDREGRRAAGFSERELAALER